MFECTFGISVYFIMFQQQQNKETLTKEKNFYLENKRFLKKANFFITCNSVFQPVSLMHPSDSKCVMLWGYFWEMQRFYPLTFKYDFYCSIAKVLFFWQSQNSGQIWLTYSSESSVNSEFWLSTLESTSMSVYLPIQKRTLPTIFCGGARNMWEKRVVGQVL